MKEVGGPVVEVVEVVVKVVVEGGSGAIGGADIGAGDERGCGSGV